MVPYLKCSNSTEAEERMGNGNKYESEFFLFYYNSTLLPRDIHTHTCADIYIHLQTFQVLHV